MNDLHPWLVESGRRLAEQHAQQRLPHALLLAGGAGTGVDRLTTWLEALLLCRPESDASAPCGQCRSCRLLRAGNHADALHLAPEGKARQIKVDSVRSLVQFSQGTPQLSSVQVVVVEEAHRLNLAAANALLKVLEEPPKGTYLLLQTSAPAALLPTIRSRVQWVRSPLPDRAAALAWLQAQTVPDADQPVDAEAAALALNLAGGQPCLALDMTRPDFLQSRRGWLETLQQQIAQPSANLQGLSTLAQADPQPILETWLHWLGDMVRLSQTGDPGWVQHTDQLDVMQRLCEDFHPKVWVLLRDAVQELSRQVGQANNLNWQLLLESFWLRIPRDTRPLARLAQRAG